MASKGSNTGTEAAIGAGVGVPLLLAFLAATGLYLRERKLRKRDARMGHGMVPSEYGYRQPGQQENKLSTIPRSEIMTQQRPHELSSVGRAG
jgi:hypothetical protein